MLIESYEFPDIFVGVENLEWVFIGGTVLIIKFKKFQ
jgi:hypothetical protein